MSRYPRPPIPRPTGDAATDALAAFRGVDQLAAQLNKNSPFVFNVQGYGAKGDGATDDTAAIQVAIDAVMAANTNGGRLWCPAGAYALSGNPFAHRINTGTNPILVDLSGAKWLTSAQIVIPQASVLRGGGRLRVGIQAAASFIGSAAISAISRSANVVSITTSGAHGLPANGTVLIDGVADASFNGGFQLLSASGSSLTFAQAATDATSSGGTVYIPLVVLGDRIPTCAGVRVDNLLIDCTLATVPLGLYSNVVAEQGGGQNVLVLGATQWGVRLERSGSTAPSGGASNYHFEDCEVLMAPGAAAGVYIRGTYGQHRGLDSFTVACTSHSTPMTVGFDISGAPGVYSRLHVEDCVDGVLIGGRGSASTSTNASAAIMVQGVTAHDSVGNVVRIANFGEVHDLVVGGVVRLLATNSLVDDMVGLSLTDDYIGLYAVGGAGALTRYSTSPNVPWRVNQTARFVNALTVGLSSGGSIGLNLQAAAGSARDLVWQSGTLARWIARTDSTAEGGADLGSNWQLIARHDDGTSLGTALAITRATLAVAFGGGVSMSALSATTGAFSDPTDATSASAASVTLVGGLGVAKGLYVSGSATFVGNNATGGHITVAPSGASGDNEYIVFTGGRAFFGYWGTSGNALIQSASGKGIVLAVNNSTWGSGTPAITITSGADVALASTTDATSSTAASLKTAGGLGVAKKAFVGTSVTAPIYDSPAATDNVLKRAGTTALTLGSALITAAFDLKFANDSTGTGVAALGMNCPAVTITAPYTWIRAQSSDGSTVYIPAFK